MGRAASAAGAASASDDGFGASGDGSDAASGATGESGDDYQFVYKEETSRRPAKVAKKAPAKPLVKKPSRKRQRQEAAFSTLPGKSPVAVPFDGGSKFAVGMVVGRPITLDDGRFGRNFQVTDIIDRSEFDYPALLQDPRVFFPVPAL